jgi:hypothetical protein
VVEQPTAEFISDLEQAGTVRTPVEVGGQQHAQVDPAVAVAEAAGIPLEKPLPLGPVATCAASTSSWMSA